MGGRIFPRARLVVSAREDFTFSHNHSPDRHLIRDIRSDARLLESKPHEALIVI